MKTEIHIENATENGITGHRSIDAYVVETLDDGSEIRGALETHGIDPTAISRLYGLGEDNVQLWLASVKEEMLSRHQIRKNVSGKLQDMVGKRI